jgi:uncharacterized membrane protein
MADEVSVGRVISRGFSVITDNPVTVVGLSLLLGGIPTVAFSYYQQSLISGDMDPDQAVGFAFVALGSSIVSVIFQAVVQGALVRATIAHANGRRAGIGESVTEGLLALLPLIGLSIIMAIGITLGFVLLIIPGIMLYVVWSVATPALVAEGIGVFDALQRSRDLTRGARWQVFGVILILGVVSVIFSAIYSATLLGTTGFDEEAMTGLAADGFSIGWILAEGLLSTVTIMVWGTVMASLYLELRNWKDGPADQALEDIFA